MKLSRKTLDKLLINHNAKVTIAFAKNNLPKLIHSSETEGIIPISRHGKVVAYIISEKDLNSLTKSSNHFSEKLKSFQEANQLTNEDIWKNTRNKDLGRQVSL